MGFYDILKAAEEEENKKRGSGNILGDFGGLAVGAGLGYLTGGVAPMLLGGAASLAPSAATLIPAFEGGLKGFGKSSEEAAKLGIAEGASTILDEAKLQASARALKHLGMTPVQATQGKVIGKNLATITKTKKPSKVESPTAKLNRYLLNAPTNLQRAIEKSRLKGFSDREIVEYMNIE